MTVTTSRPVSDRDIAILVEAMQGDLIQVMMNDKKKSETETRTWTWLGD